MLYCGIQFRWFILLSLVCLLTGCVYARLLEIKVQLSEFDENVQVEKGEGFSLAFNNPVLYREDLDYLSKLKPTVTEYLTGGARTVYQLQRQYLDDSEQKVNLYFVLEFNEDDLLKRWTFSPVFLAMVPAEFLEYSVRALGDSTIFRFRRQIKANLAAIDPIDLPVPTSDKIIAVLGDPHLVEYQETSVRYVYYFDLLTDYVEEGYEDHRVSEIKLDFNKADGKLLKTWGRFAGMKISVDYRKITKKNRQKVASGV